MKYQNNRFKNFCYGLTVGHIQLSTTRYAFSAWHRNVLFIL